MKAETIKIPPTVKSLMTKRAAELWRTNSLLVQQSPPALWGHLALYFNHRADLEQVRAEITRREKAGENTLTVINNNGLEGVHPLRKLETSLSRQSVIELDRAGIGKKEATEPKKITRADPFDG